METEFSINEIVAVLEISWDDQGKRGEKYVGTGKVVEITKVTASFTINIPYRPVITFVELTDSKEVISDSKIEIEYRFYHLENFLTLIRTERKSHLVRVAEIESILEELNA